MKCLIRKRKLVSHTFQPPSTVGLPLRTNSRGREKQKDMHFCMNPRWKLAENRLKPESSLVRKKQYQKLSVRSFLISVGDARHAAQLLSGQDLKMCDKCAAMGRTIRYCSR